MAASTHDITSSNQEQRVPDFGALVISLDFEIHWGVRDRYPIDGNYRQNLLGVRQSIPRMLDLFDEFAIAATWATVGFLFATSRQELESFYPTLRPAYEDPVLSPYQEPVGDNEHDDPFHFAPSLIKMIAQRPGQEIATHTFSHYYCLERGQTRAAFRADLQSAVAIAHKYGYQLRSIVFPRNQFNPDYTDLLVDAGIIGYRGNESGWMYQPAVTKDNQKISVYAARWLDRYINLSGDHLTDWSNVLQRNGLCNIRSSRFLRSYTPRWRYLEPFLLHRIIACLQAAAISKKIFHLWWHPHNFGVHTDENMALLRKILQAFTEFRETYGMRSLTMAQVAMIAREYGIFAYSRQPAAQCAAGRTRGD